LKHDQQFELLTQYKPVATDHQPATFFKQKTVDKQRGNMNARGRETRCTPHASPLCCKRKRQWPKQPVGSESCSGLALALQRLQMVEKLVRGS